MMIVPGSAFIPTAASGCDDPLTDSYWGNVELLCWCNGADNGTTFTDETGNYVNATNPSLLVTTQSSTPKFGSAAADFPGDVSQALAWGDVGDFDFLHDGTMDFTAEMWLLTANDRTALFATCNGATNERGVFFHVRDGGGLGLHLYKGLPPATVALDVEFDLWDANWHHIVFQYDSSETDSYQIFVDGYLLGASAATSTYTNLSHTHYLHNGRAPTTVGYSKACAMDDIRITKGIARYPASGFTPPCRQFPNTD